MRRNYEPWEDDLIRERYGSQGVFRGLIQQLPHRTANSIHIRAALLGVRAHYREWTSAEDKILRQYYPDMAKAEAHLKGRTREALYMRSRKLRLGPPVRNWSAAEDDALRKLTPTHSDEQIAIMLGRTARAVLRRRFRLGIRKTEPTVRVLLPILADVIAEANARGVRLRSLTGALGCASIVPREDARRVSHKAIAKVVAVFGGHLYAEWDD
ncbi:hypothetical protein ASD04_15085 [Devosia sp. Root436]|uniref:hypothetical protein n=1 Tax=Devosia sp. Root436 TaxID=1736537 RepID=UPI0006F4CB30|nr:hypothetical protein [Devosia sp. Root436]KQX35360.1 hypothetical protein ASD04_15085 [Devosia sp. Root436]